MDLNASSRTVDASGPVPSEGSDDGSDDAVERVLVVSKTHLDVGFTDLASVVRSRYLDDFFPRAVATAAQLRARGGPERLRWTTGSWILSEALAAADSTRRRQLEEAIEAGDLCWHALPFTLHTEYCDRSLLEHGLSISAELDRRFGRRTTAAKVTDVPGHTRGLVSLLAAHGVELLHVGVNPASAAPVVPERFVWRDPAALDGGHPPEICVMYQPGGYGAVQVVPGTRTAVAVELTGDNLGPPDADAVVATFAALAQRFPGATVDAATLDDVAALMASVRGSLPLVDGEIGDSWIHGVASDPAKTAAFRALCRERVRWIAEGRAVTEDPALSAASTRLLLVAEHTWGMDQKEHWPQLGHWSASELAELRSDPSTVRFESSWAEQRSYLSEFVESLRAGGRGDLADRAAAVLSSATAVEAPVLDGMVDADLSVPVDIGGFRLRFSPVDGAVTGLVDHLGREWATNGSPLARFAVQTFDDSDFQRWFATYNAGTLPEDEWWARWDNTKPGLEHSGARAAWYRPTVDGMWHGARAGRDAAAIRLAFPVGADEPVALPESAWVTVTAGDSAGELELELSWFGLPAARWPVAWWWSFAPLVRSPEQWVMTKLAEPVSPFDVVDSAGRWLHAVEGVAHPEGIAVDLVDSALVAPGEPRLLEWDGRQVDMAGGWHLCLTANLWGTNFPMWTEGHGRVRVTLRFGRPA